MKRSEALELIWKEMDEFYSEFMVSSRLADMILTRLEQAGMKPPYNNDEFQRQAKIYIQPEGYAWEPEDEI